MHPNSTLHQKSPTIQLPVTNLTTIDDKRKHRLRKTCHTQTRKCFNIKPLMKKAKTDEVVPKTKNYTFDQFY